MLTFVSEGGSATLSSSVASDKPAKHTHLQPGASSPGMSLHAKLWKSSSVGSCSVIHRTAIALAVLVELLHTSEHLPLSLSFELLFRFKAKCTLYRACQLASVRLFCWHSCACLHPILLPINSTSSFSQCTARCAAAAAGGCPSPRPHCQCPAPRPSSPVPSHRVSSTVLAAVGAESTAADPAPTAAGHRCHACLPATVPAA